MPLLILCLASFLNWMNYGLVYPIFATSIFHENSIFLSDSSTAVQGFWLGVLLAACPIAQFLSSSPLGQLSDRKGRKSLMQSTTLLIFIGALIAAFGIFAKSLFILILGRVVTGLGAGNNAVINSSVADFSSRTQKAKNFGLIAMANGIGFAIGPFVGGKLSVYGYALPFIVAALFTLVSFLLITFFFSETLKEKKTGRLTIALGLSRLWETTIAAKFRVIFLSFFIFCFGWSFYWEFIPVTWIKSYNQDASQIGNFYAFGSLIYVISSGLLIRPIVKKFKPFTILLLSLGALGVFLSFLIHAKLESYWLNIGAQQFLIALVFPVGTAIVSNLTSQSDQGETMGVFQALQAFAFAVTPFFGGVLLHFSYFMPVMIGAASMFLACLIILAGYKKTALR